MRSWTRQPSELQVGRKLLQRSPGGLESQRIVGWQQVSQTLIPVCGKLCAALLEIGSHRPGQVDPLGRELGWQCRPNTFQGNACLGEMIEVVQVSGDDESTLPTDGPQLLRQHLGKAVATDVYFR